MWANSAHSVFTVARDAELVLRVSGKKETPVRYTVIDKKSKIDEKLDYSNLTSIKRNVQSIQTVATVIKRQQIMQRIIMSSNEPF